MREKIRSLLRHAVRDPLLNIEVETPKNEQFGDYSTNIAMLLAKKEKQPPQAVSEGLASVLRGLARRSDFESITGTPQGFINFRVSLASLTDNLRDILKKN